MSESPSQKVQAGPLDPPSTGTLNGHIPKAVSNGDRNHNRHNTDIPELRVPALVLYDRDFPRKTSEVHVGRHAIQVGTRVLVGGEKSAELALAAGEMLANSATHGDGPLMRLTMTLDAGVLRVAVHDAGCEPIDFPDGDLLGESGRGLLIVTVLMEEMRGDCGLSQDASGTTAWFEVPLP